MLEWELIMKTVRTCVWATILLTTLSARSQIQPINVEVVDASNNLLGTTKTYYTSGVQVMLEVDSHVVVAIVGRNHLATNNPVYFASNDCSGQAYAAWSPVNIFDPHSIVTLSNSVYAGPRATQQAVLTQSRLDAGINGCQVASVLRSDLVPVAFVRDLSPHFQAPFGIRAAAASASATAPALSPGAIIILLTSLVVAALFLLRQGS
jgi:hypothetical protein